MIGEELHPADAVASIDDERPSRGATCYDIDGKPATERGRIGHGDLMPASPRRAGDSPGHELVLAELGLEPVLDLRLRLGEASDGLLALPHIEAAGVLFRQMATFREVGVTER